MGSNMPFAHRHRVTLPELVALASEYAPVAEAEWQRLSVRVDELIVKLDAEAESERQDIVETCTMIDTTCEKINEYLTQELEPSARSQLLAALTYLKDAATSAGAEEHGAAYTELERQLTDASACLSEAESCAVALTGVTVAHPLQETSLGRRVAAHAAMMLGVELESSEEPN
eukprot:gnl/Chilomastix_cuspidata/4835.p2 GENE.gnl/Chilomastix_cuspidata/4835~~gnl/Chilomastix_cuspidata/4835.p2  ORF type:complete len:173 (-),score=34.61 gnl/Chilomastix_cuspidata/4835:110-628(-)